MKLLNCIFLFLYWNMLFDVEKLYQGLLESAIYFLGLCKQFMWHGGSCFLIFLFCK